MSLEVRDLFKDQVKDGSTIRCKVVGGINTSVLIQSFVDTLVKIKLIISHITGL